MQKLVARESGACYGVHMTTTQAPIQTSDLHFVIKAFRSADDPTGEWQFVAETAPMGWLDAQKVWDKLDDARVATGRRMSELYYMVRSVDDPRWQFLFVGAPKLDANPYTGRRYVTSGSVRAARVAAQLRGHGGKPGMGQHGGSGGWIYDNTRPDRDGRRWMLCQGWSSYALMARRNGWVRTGADGRYYVLALPQPEPQR